MEEGKGEFLKREKNFKVLKLILQSQIWNHGLTLCCLTKPGFLNQVSGFKITLQLASR